MTDRRILVIHNPAAGRSGTVRLARVVDRLKALGARVELCATTRPGHAAELARGATRARCDVVAVAGGDGTLNEVVNGLAADPPPLAVIATGTANVVARDLGLPADPDQLARLILAGRTRSLSLGRAGDRLFLFTAGAGFDAEAVAALSPALKRRLGRLAYVVAAASVLARYRFPVLTVTADGTEIAGAGAIVMNGSLYGGGFRIAPAESLDRPGFTVCVLARPGRPAALAYLAAAARGRLSGRGDVAWLRARTVTVDGPPGAPVQIDGDPAAGLPLRLTADAARIAVLA